MTGVIYPCATHADERRVVATTLFQSMRFMYWYEIADRLRYVGITRAGIDRALLALTADGSAERMTSGDGRYIYRYAFPTTGKGC